MSGTALGPDDTRRLLDAALDAIEQVLVTGAFTEPAVGDADGALAAPGASFVTLTRAGALLGCIGTLAAYRPLLVDVAHHAVAAAFSDPRLPAITPADFCAMDLEVSVLSPPEPLPVRDRAELTGVLEPGRDGLIVESRRGRATFLPSVWAQLPAGEDFLDALWRKAGWSPGDWPADLRVARYDTVKFGDPPPRSLPRLAA